MILPVLAVSVVIILVFGLGIALVVGALRGWKVLFEPPDAQYVPSFWMGRMLFGQKCHRKYIFANSLLFGIVLVVLAVYLAVKVCRDLMIGF